MVHIGRSALSLFHVNFSSRFEDLRRHDLRSIVEEVVHPRGSRVFAANEFRRIGAEHNPDALGRPLTFPCSRPDAPGSLWPTQNRRSRSLMTDCDLVSPVGAPGAYVVVLGPRELSRSAAQELECCSQITHGLKLA
jgi:hypothetical protein